MARLKLHHHCQSFCFPTFTNLRIVFCSWLIMMAFSMDRIVPRTNQQPTFWKITAKKIRDRKQWKAHRSETFSQLGVHISHQVGSALNMRKCTRVGQGWTAGLTDIWTVQKAEDSWPTVEAVAPRRKCTFFLGIIDLMWRRPYVKDFFFQMLVWYKTH